MATTSFADLKRSRSELTNNLVEELNKLNTKNSYVEDESKYWELQVDKSFNGSAVIRFLSSPVGEDKPFIRYWEHGFQGPPKGDQKGMWYIEKSLTTLKLDDPCAEYNMKLWETGLTKNQEIVRKQKRKLYYVSNIYVIRDGVNPENEGKVFLFKYGKKIFDKINDQMNPAFDDMVAVNPFDLWEGANFKLRAMKVDGYRNYDKSEFDKPSALLDDDDELEKVWKAEHSLEGIIALSKFKSYDELEKRLYKVLRIDSSLPLSTSDEPREKAPKPTKLEVNDNPPWVDPDDDDSNETNFFQKFKEE